MNRLAEFTKSLGELWDRHGGEIMVGIGTVGLLLTAGLGIDATIKAVKIVDERKKELEVDKLDAVETIKEVWKPYTPMVLTGIASTICIACGTKKTFDRAAGVAAALAISETNLKDYKSKVKEMIGDKKSKQVDTEVIVDRANKNNKNCIVLTGKGKTLFIDDYSKQKFRSDVETIRKAFNDYDCIILNEGYADINELYDEIGIENIGPGDIVGYNRHHRVEPVFTGGGIDNDTGEPYIILSFSEPPSSDYRNTSFA